MDTQNLKEEILKFIQLNPGYSYRQIRFRLELNEGTLNRALINLTKTGFIRKSEDKRYFQR